MFFILRERITGLFLLLLGLFVLLFIPTAYTQAETLAVTSTYRASAAIEFVSSPIDSLGYTNLSLSFDFDATTLDFGPPQDTFTYGYRTGGLEYSLGTFLGLAGSTTAELGSVVVELPLSASVNDLVIFVSVVANSAASSDKVELRNVVLTGELTPVIVDVCPNISGNQETVPQGYEKNTEGDCTLIPPEPIDVCTNITGLQEVLPIGYEKDLAGDCVLVPPVLVDICLNLTGLQETLPAGYEINVDGDCVIISIPVVDVCPNLPGEQIEVPANFLLNSDGDCLPVPVSPTDLCPNLTGVQVVVPPGQQLNAAGECVVIVVTPPPVPPTPTPKMCPRGFSKWIDRFSERHIWRADDVYSAIILIGGPTNRKLNKDKAHFLYIAGPTEVGDKYYRRFHKIVQVCVKG